MSAINPTYKFVQYVVREFDTEIFKTRSRTWEPQCVKKGLLTHENPELNVDLQIRLLYFYIHTTSDWTYSTGQLGVKNEMLAPEIVEQSARVMLKNLKEARNTSISARDQLWKYIFNTTYTQVSPRKKKKIIYLAKAINPTVDSFSPTQVRAYRIGRYASRFFGNQIVIAIMAMIIGFITFIKISLPLANAMNRLKNSSINDTAPLMFIFFFSFVLIIYASLKLFGFNIPWQIEFIFNHIPDTRKEVENIVIKLPFHFAKLFARFQGEMAASLAEVTDEQERERLTLSKKNIEQVWMDILDQHRDQAIMMFKA